MAFQQAMLIPAKDEPSTLIERCKSFCEAQKGTLLLLLINQAEGSNISEANQTLWEKGLSSGTHLWKKDHLTLIQWKNNSALLLLDRFSPERQIPPKEGVGLARKIAADIISQLIANNFIANPWIYSSDADCQWPENYFEKPESLHQAQQSGLRRESEKDNIAAHFAFEHAPCTDSNIPEATRQNISKATHLYEKSLHYYRDGLSWAGSPYNFYTIGSCLAFDYQAYCEVRGFPCRAAGEDFYLLNKLAKLGSICQLDTQSIVIESRLSQRAPFGTGPAVGDILEKQLNHDNYLSYHPQCFADLKELLNNSHDVIIHQRGSDNTLFALHALGLEKFLRHLKQQNSKPEQFTREFHTWFDAFRTLKFIHYLREQFYPSIPLAQGIQQLKQWQQTVTER